MTVFYVFLLVSLLFTAVLVFKHFTKHPLCAICISISATWLALLILDRLGRFHDNVLLALLMGQSVTGIFYLLRKRVPPSLRIFTLPFFLSLTAIFYVLITNGSIIPAFGLISVLWAIAWLVFTYRSDPGKKLLAESAMDCCEDD